MIIDCFPYFNESELLELRIKLLYEHVDMFVITEGDHTHKGIPKPYTVLDTLKELQINLDKIKVVHVKLPNALEESDHWVRERMQRDAAVEFINDGDIAFISDCDEILNPGLLHEFTNHVLNNPNAILRTPLVYLTGSAEYRVMMDDGTPVLWPSPFFCTTKHLENHTLSELREDQARNRHKINDFETLFPTAGGQIMDSGWHFTWMGGRRRMHVKYKNCLHDDEFSLQQHYTPTEGGHDPLYREQHNLKKYPLENLPKEVFQLERVRKFLFPYDDSSTDILNTVIQNNINVIASYDVMPPEHVEYLKSLDISPNVIYDIGACVLYWERHARAIWPNSEIYLFDASFHLETLYNNTNQKYELCVLTDTNGKSVKFYEDPMKPSGSSYYKENTEFYNETHATERLGYTLDYIVEKNNWPLPNLIKLDVQGAELDILKGATKCLSTCDDIILESQHINYNDGAPMVQDVIDFMKSINFKLISNFSKQAVDGDYHFKKINKE